MITKLFVYHLKFRFLTLTKLPKADPEQGWASGSIPGAERFGSRIEKFPFLEKQLKVKITFERFTPSHEDK